MDAGKPKKLRLELKAELAAELAAISDTWVGQDLLQSIAFLHGRRGLHGGIEYLKPGSFEERSGRQALARLLRSSQPLSRIVRYMLANLVDPEAGDTRAILLMRRTRARLPASIRDHDIAYFIAWRVENGTAMKVAKLDAQDYAKERFNKKISVTTVNRAWSKHGKDMRGQVRRTLADLKKGYIPPT
jgi:hypothetical protein